MRSLIQRLKVTADSSCLCKHGYGMVVQIFVGSWSGVFAEGYLLNAQ